MNESQFVKLLEHKFASEGYVTQRELGVGYGIADLVLFKFNKNKCVIRRNNKQYKKLNNEVYFKIFDYLPEFGSKRKSRLEILSKNLNISKNTLKYKYLKKLENDGFIRRVDENLYFKINGWMPLAGEIIAIEAKMKDWKRGMFQANRYKSFAHKTFLAFPQEKGYLVDREMLRKHNIGLILFNVENREIKSIQPQKKIPLNWYKFNLASEFAINKRFLKENFV